MDKRIKTIPVIVDLKNTTYSAYFIMLGFIGLFLYKWLILGGQFAKVSLFKTPMFFLGAIGILLWILPVFSDLVHSESKELLLSLPLGSWTFGFFRAIRLFVIYVVAIIAIYAGFIFTSVRSDVNFALSDVLQITGALFFLSGLGMVSLLLGRHLAIGFGVPIFWLLFSFFYGGSGLSLLHPCQWLVPKPYIPEIHFTLALWTAGLILHLISSWLLQKREYLMNG